MSEDTENKGANGAEGDFNVDQLKTDLDKAKKDYLYLLAEFDNYRKNSIKERSELLKYGAEKFIRDFLGIFDNFERALSTEVKDTAAFREGVNMIATEFKALLQRYGVEEVKSQGEVFDPTKHEAISSEPREDLPAGHVATVFKKAYKFHDKLMRPAQVTVATQPAIKN